MKATIEQHLCLVLCIKFLIHANLDFEKYIVSPSLLSVHWPQLFKYILESTIHWMNPYPVNKC